MIGSRAYGLQDQASDTDRRGIYLPPAKLQWSLYGVPEQLENDQTQEVYWELEKFIVLALKAKPNVLECLYSPIVEQITPLGEELLAMRNSFLSKLVFQTFSGYVASQFKKMQTDIRNQGRVKWKHVMHLMRTGEVEANLVTLNETAKLSYLADLIAQKQSGREKGTLAATNVRFHRSEYERLTKELELAYEQSKLPEVPTARPALNDLLVRLRLAKRTH